MEAGVEREDDPPVVARIAQPGRRRPSHHVLVPPEVFLDGVHGSAKGEIPAPGREALRRRRSVMSADADVDAEARQRVEEEAGFEPAASAFETIAKSGERDDPVIFFGDRGRSAPSRSALVCSDPTGLRPICGP